jgi:hypothetical protein
VLEPADEAAAPAAVQTGAAPRDDVQGRVLALRRPAPTLVRLSSSRPGAPEGEPLALAAQVRTLVSGGLAPTGSVTFRIGPRLLGTAVLDAVGQAVLDGVRLEPGVHAITAVYPGDDQHSAATSSPLPQAVTVAASPVVVLVNAPADGPGGVHLEAELVDPHTGRLAEDATGALVFTAGSTLVGRADLVAGHARVVVAHLPPGRLRAAFAGDTEHAPATGDFLGEAAGS